MSVPVPIFAADTDDRRGGRSLEKAKESVKEKLAESFRALVLQMPLEKITIKDITDGAGVIRPTFYNHFKDKYDLIEWIWYQDVVSPVRTFWDMDMLIEARKLIFARILKEKEYYLRISRMEGQNSFPDIMMESIRQMCLEYIEAKGNNSGNEFGITKEDLADFYAHTVCYVLLRWIRSGMKQTPEEMSKIYEYISTNSLEQLMQFL